MEQAPITLLTGFLGAGKTTVLNRILHGDHGLRVAVLVNDFGAINIDAQLVVGVEGETINLANGCICCTIRGDLLQAVEKLLNRPQPPEYLLIEASGVSDPAQIVQTFVNSTLAHRIQVDSILAILDADQFEQIDRKHRGLARDQIIVADIIAINKVDLVSDEQLQHMRDWVRRNAPDARILETTYGNLPLPLVLGVGAYQPERTARRKAQDVHVHEADAPHDHDHDHALVFDSWHWRTDAALSLRHMRRAIDSLPTTIYRAKGIIYTADIPEQKIVLQVVGKRASLMPGGKWKTDETPHSQIVVIAAHGGLDTAALQATFENCIAANLPKTEMGEFVATVLNWLRRT